ncbi:hypothetical protein, partial [Bacteroides faecis]|uniref:hypothetical protein n=2 Tax=Bacteroides faecis TaxID=674529 RepID=UPI0019610B64
GLPTSSPTTILIMKKKSDKQVIRPDTCAKCNNGTIVPTAKGNPRVAYCFILKRRFVLIVREIVFMRIN